MSRQHQRSALTNTIQQAMTGNRPHTLKGPGEGETQQRCPLCKGTGYLRRDVSIHHPLFGKAVPCACTLQQQKQRQQQRLMDLSGLLTLSRFQHACFETYNPFALSVQEAYNRAIAFAHRPQGWLLLIGPYGCGKTHLAVSIAQKQIEQGSMVIFQVVPRLLDYLRAGFAATEQESYDQRFQLLCEVDLLILDDFGAQSNTPWATEKLFQLLNDRYNASAPTVITMNSSAWHQSDPRLISRFHDTHLVTRIMMEHAGDYRIYKQDQ